jgi:hypothetical protein
MIFFIFRTSKQMNRSDETVWSPLDQSVISAREALMVLLQPNCGWGDYPREAVFIFIAGFATAVAAAIAFPNNSAIADRGVVLLLGLLASTAVALAIGFRRRRTVALRETNAGAPSRPPLVAPSSTLPQIDAPAVSSLPRFDEYDDEGRLQGVGSIRLLPVTGVAQGKQMSSSLDTAEECAICLGRLGDSGGETTTRKLAACGHVFHRRCVQQWLRLLQPNCPMCRRK